MIHRGTDHRGTDHHGTDLGKTNVPQGVQPEVEVVSVLEMEPLRLKKKINNKSMLVFLPEIAWT